MSTLRSKPVLLGRGFSVEFAYEDGKLDAIWSPRMPHGRWARALLPSYRMARDAFLVDLVPLVGNILVLDTAGESGVSHG